MNKFDYDNYIDKDQHDKTIWNILDSTDFSSNF